MSLQNLPLRPLSATTLPNELLVLVIDNLVPSNPRPIALRPSDPITKTLLSLTQGSKLLYSIAAPQLYSACLYIDSFERMNHLAHTLKHNLSLRSHATSLYLAPWEENDDRSRHILRLCKLLELLAPKLKRLILHTPNLLRQHGGYQSWGGVHCAAYINKTLFNLTSLEVFSSVSDHLWMQNDHGQSNDPGNLALREWPKLRVLMLAAVEPALSWNWCHSMPALDRLLLTDCFGGAERDWKAMYGQSGNAHVKKLETVVVGDNLKKASFVGHDNWKDTDPLHIRIVNVPVIGPDFAHATHYTRDWMVEQMLAGQETF